jgi:sulfonate transport system substrate-binding protein
MNNKVRTPVRTMVLLGALTLFGPTVAQSEGGEVRIGYQKSSTLMMIIKSKGTLERELTPLGLKVRWTEYASGPPLLAALNDGSIDMCADISDSSAVFAQATGAKLTYIAQEAPSPSAQAIMVRANSPITKVADLKGRKVAVSKGTGSHYLLLVALEQAGLTFNQVEPAYLTPPDGRAALDSGRVAAWVTWDPFLAAAQRQSKTRILADGHGLTDYQRYYLAATPFAEKRANVIGLIFEELQKTGGWVKQHPGEAAAVLAPIWELDPDIVALANRRRSYAVRAIVIGNLGEQQKIADHFFAEGLLPRRIVPADVSIWKPGS